MKRNLLVIFLILFGQTATAKESQAQLLLTSPQQITACQTLNCHTIQKNQKILIIKHPQSKPFEQLFSTFVAKNQLKLVDDELLDIQSAIFDWRPDIVVMPQQGPSFTYGPIVKEYIKTVKTKYNRQQPIQVLQYETPDSRLAAFHYFLALNPREVDLQQRAILSHVSQIKRTAFLQIAKAQGRLTLSDFKHYTRHRLPEKYFAIEAYQFLHIKNARMKQDVSQKHLHETLPFDKRDSLVLVAPHPDDVELGASGLMIKAWRAHLATTVLNATSGGHAAILAQDALESVQDSPNLTQAILAHTDNPDAWLEDAELKSKIRAHESKRALGILNQYTNVIQMALPFYDHKYQIDHKKDRLAVRKQLAKLYHEVQFRKGQLILALPLPADAHICHRTTTQLFLSEFLRLSKKYPKEEMVLIYYRTPWTGSNNLYIYSDIPPASDLQAYIGSERVQGKGGNGLALLATGQLGADKAFALEIQSL